MTISTAYEVRVQRGVHWRVEGIFDDELLAVAAAKKVEIRAGRNPVVVIQEVYDAARNHLKSRSIYRSPESAIRPDSSCATPDTKPRSPFPLGLTPTTLMVVLVGAALGLAAILRPYLQ